MIGQTISHYKITEKLGEGGMGVVYKAEDTKLKRTVALKFLAAHLLNDGETKARVQREAEAAAALTHSNIAAIYDVDESEGQSFIAMEFVGYRRRHRVFWLRRERRSDRDAAGVPGGFRTSTGCIWGSA